MTERSDVPRPSPTAHHRADLYGVKSRAAKGRDKRQKPIAPGDAVQTRFALAHYAYRKP